MKRHCGPEDRYVGMGDQRCGMFFDDVERSTVCPHDRVDGGPVDAVETFLWLARVDQYLRECGLPVEYGGPGGIPPGMLRSGNMGDAN